MRREECLCPAGIPACIQFVCIQKRRPRGNCSQIRCAFPAGWIVYASQGQALCTAKEIIHPQYPQGYPQMNPREMAHFSGLWRDYPQYPQVFHSRYPPEFILWIYMWTIKNRAVSMVTHVLGMNNYTRQCMFVRLFLWIPGWITSGFSKRKSAKMNENVKSPKNLPQAADSAQIVLFQQKSCLHICRQHGSGIKPGCVPARPVEARGWRRAVRCPVRVPQRRFLAADGFRRQTGRSALLPRRR